MKVKTRFAKAVSLLLVVALVMTSGVLSFAETDNAVPQEEAAAVETTQQPSAAPAVQEPQDNQTAVREETTATAPETQPTEAADSQTDVSKESTPSTGKADKAASESTEKKDAEKNKAKDTRARTLTATAADGARITVNAPEGAFDKDVKVRVSTVSAGSVRAAVKAQDKNVGDVAAYDITIVDKSGKEVQPAKAVSVKIAGASVDGSASAVYHVNDAKTSATPVSASTGGSSASFAANHFSIYVVVTDGDEDSPVLITYRFFDGNKELKDYEQTVKNGDELKKPEAPSKDGHKFIGWYDGSKEFTGFGTQSGITGKARTVDLKAKYDNVIYAYFMDGTGSDARVIRTKEGVSGNSVTTDDVTFAVSADESITGWYTDKALTQRVSSVKLADKDVYLYPKVEDGYWITYDSNGGSYIEPDFFASGAAAKAPSDPSKLGYVFDGWYTSAEGGNKVDFAGINASTTVHAHWTAAKNTKYTVIHWQENANDDGYSFAASETKTGTTGAQTAAGNKTYLGFTAQTVTQKSIAGDGSTIVNVYYKRNVYEVKFYSNSGWFSSSSEYTQLRITAKFGAYIGDKWPTYNNSSSWATKDNGSTYQVNIDTMPYGGANFYGPKTDQGSETAYYYVEVLPGESGTVYNGVTYKLDHKDTSPGTGFTVTNEDKYPITGFTYSGGTANKRPYNNAKFYYTRNSYDIVFMNNGTQDKKVSKKYQQSISDAGYTPQAPAGMEDYIFDGWYDNELGEGTAYVFDGKTMPAQNITLYAKWKAPEYTVTAHGSSDGSVTVSKGGTVSPEDFDSVKPDLAADEQWMGWALRTGSEGSYVYTPFNYNTKINRNYDLYPYIVSKAKFTVTYDAGEGSGTAPSDSEKYAGDSHAKVKTKGDLTGPEDKPYFLGWKSSADGSIYQPGDKIIMKSNVTLTAQWGSKPAKATITYDPGTGNGDRKSEEISNNGSHTVKNAANLGYTKEGYKFTGWQYTGKDGKTAIVEAGKVIHADTEGSNVLTAQWARDFKDVSVDPYEGKYDGAEHSITVKGTIAGDSIKYSIDGGNTWSSDKPSYKDVKTSNNGKYDIKVKVSNGDETVILDSYVKIVPRSIKMISGSASKEYDGTPLTKKDVTESGDGFVKGEGATYDVTGTITNVGKTGNKFTYTLNEGTKAKNYEITTEEGTLEVTPVDVEVVVTITEHSGEHEYDGTEKTVKGYDVSIDNDKYTKDDFTFDGNDIVKATDAGTYDMELAAKDFTNTNENFSKVTFKIVDGQLKIKEKAVKFTGESASKVYNGETQEITGITEAGLLDGHKYSELRYSAKGKDVGGYDGTFSGDVVIKDAKGNDVTKNYEVTKTPGKLTITAYTDEVIVTITEHSGEHEYDGTEKTVKGYDVSTNNDKYSKDDFTFDGNDIVKATDAGTYDMELAAKDFTNTNENFSKVTFKIVDGQLKIKKKAVEFTGESASKVYNGETQEITGITEAGLLDGHDYSGLKYSAKGKDVGGYDGAFSGDVVIKDAKGNDVTKNYEVTKTPGKLTITAYTDEVIVTITEHGGEYEYDGTEKTVKGYGVSIDNDKYTEDDFTFDGNDIVKATDAGTYDMELAAKDFTNTNKNFSKVTFKIVDGQLKIKKKAVEFTGESASKVYNGETQEITGITEAGLLDGHDYSGLNYSAKGKDVGGYDGAFSGDVVIKNAKGNDVTKNYNVTKTPGKLTITAYTDEVIVTIKEHGGKAKYDGAEKTVTGYDVKNISNKLYTEKDFEFSGKAEVKGTDAGTYDMELKAGDFRNTNSNFSKVKFVIEDGQLEIGKRTVKLTSASANKEYDGTPLTKEDVTESGDGFVKGEGAAYDVTGTITNVGKVDNEFTYELNKDTKASNYEITKEEGTLEVTAVEAEVIVTITEHSGKAKYDGTEKTVTGYDVKSISNKLYTKDDFEFSGKAEVKGTDAGTYDMELKPGDFKNTNKNFSKVKFVIEDGQLEIEKRTVKMTSASASKEYDGTPLTDKNVTESGDGFVKGEGAAYDVTGTITNVGKVDNKFTYELDKNTKAGNYEITTEEGTLEVTPVDAEVVVTITEHSGKAKYDGTEKTVTGYDVKSISNKLYTKEDFKFSGKAEVKGTDAGKYDMELKSGDFKNTNSNFSKVKFVIEDGQLEIEKRTVKLTSASANKEYDGTPLTKKDVTESGDGFVKGEGAAYDVTGTITNVGKTGNKFTYTLNEGTKAKNYEITTEEGTLEVIPGKIADYVTLTPKDTEKVYDGTPLAAGEATAEDKNGGELKIEYSTDGENWTEDFASITATNVADTKTVQVRVSGTNYEGYVEGTETVTVTPAPLKVVTPNASKYYDGKPLTKEGTLTGLVNDETATLNTTGTQTKIGRSDNTYELIWDGTAIEGNYTIEEEIGVLEVRPESPGPDDPTKPEDPDKPGKHDSHKNVNKTDNVNESQTRTGDDSNMLLYGGTGLASVAAALIALFARRRKEENEE